MTALESEKLKIGDTITYWNGEEKETTKIFQNGSRHFPPFLITTNGKIVFPKQIIKL